MPTQPTQPTMPTILVVEDEASITELLRLVLEDEGYRVVAAADGREGLARLAEERPHLVLSDVMMPAMDGRDLARAMYADRAYRRIPLVLMSAAGEAIVGDAPCAAFLSKPFDLDQLLTTIGRLLGAADSAAR